MVAEFESEEEEALAPDDVALPVIDDKTELAWLAADDAPEAADDAADDAPEAADEAPEAADDADTDAADATLDTELAMAEVADEPEDPDDAPLPLPAGLVAVELAPLATVVVVVDPAPPLEAVGRLDSVTPTVLHNCWAASSAVDTAFESQDCCTQDVMELMNSWLLQRQDVSDALQLPVDELETQLTKQLG